MHTRVSFCAWCWGRKGGLPCTCVPGPSTNPLGSHSGCVPSTGIRQPVGSPSCRSAWGVSLRSSGTGLALSPHAHSAQQGREC